MLQSLFWTAAGLTGAGGGLALVAMFSPAAALVIKAALDFLRSPLGMIAGALAIGFVLFASGYVSGDLHGAGQVRRAWRLSDALIASKMKERAAAAKATAAAETNLAITAIERHADINERKVSDYAKSHPGGDCRSATGDDVRRLLDIGR